MVLARGLGRLLFCMPPRARLYGGKGGLPLCASMPQVERCRAVESIHSCVALLCFLPTSRNSRIPWLGTCGWFIPQAIAPVATTSSKSYLVVDACYLFLKARGSCTQYVMTEAGCINRIHSSYFQNAWPSAPAKTRFSCNSYQQSAHGPGYENTTEE